MSVGIGFSKFGHRLVVQEYFVPQILLFENRKNVVDIQRTVFFERKLEGIVFLQKLCNFLASKGEKNLFMHGTTACDSSHYDVYIFQKLQRFYKNIRNWAISKTVRDTAKIKAQTKHNFLFF